MTKAEVEIELIHAIHYLSFEEMQEMLKNVLSSIKREKKPVNTMTDLSLIDNTFNKEDFNEFNMIDELLKNPLQVTDPKPLSREEIYASRKD
jgi:hypothetical protein